MKLLLLLLLITCADLASAQVRLYGSGLTGIGAGNAFVGVYTGAGVSAQWRRVLVQTRLAEVGVVGYNVGTNGSDEVRREHDQVLGFGAEVHYVQPVYGPLYATIGAGVTSHYYPEPTLRPAPPEEWHTTTQTFLGVVVGRADRIRVQARIGLLPFVDGVTATEKRVGVLVPLRF